MRILSLVIIWGLFLSAVYYRAGHPHGPGFRVSCSKCHSTKSWKFDREIYSFDHKTTGFPLTGQHGVTDCRECHKSLVFSEAGSECIDCHSDIHQATVGFDCSRCHTTSSWLVNNISEIHRLSRFPLLGAHQMADCYDCHKSESLVRFDVAGIECIDCHRSDYQSTTTPNHADAGFDEDCSRCHSISAFQWAGAGFSHAFFPLTLGHSGHNCSDCHTGGNYTTISSDCYSCHQNDYNNTTNPAHTSLNLSLVCTQCHSTSPGWKPASFTQHDSQAFPIYTGRHRGVWDSCTSCHTDPANYAQFSCITCHEHNKTEMDDKHQGTTGYSYTSAACLSCHPKGDAD